MTMDLVDVTAATAGAGERVLERAAASWAASGDRETRIAQYQALTGCSELRAAEFADMSRATEFREEQLRLAGNAERAERLEAGNWMAARNVVNDNLRAGLPADCNPVQRAAMGLIAGMSDEPSRVPSAPSGSALNPVQFFDGVDRAYEQQQRDRAAGGAQRSFSQSVDDALIERAKAQCSDSYMLIARSQLQSRRKHAEMARHEAELAGASRTSPGTGWPEIER